MEIVFIIFLDGGRSVIIIAIRFLKNSLEKHTSFKVIILRLIFSEKNLFTHEALVIDSQSHQLPTTIKQVQNSHLI